MRRVAFVLTGAVAVLALAATPVVAQAPSPTPSAPAAPPAAGAGQPVCTITDSKLTELSGLVAVDNGYLTINDSNPDASAKRIFRLDNQCKVASQVSYPTQALDPEDLALAPDGTVWAADIGDNRADRRTVALWKLAPGAKSPVIHRVSYPDGARDAEALLISGDGTPVIVTKEVGKPAGIYVPSAALAPNSQNGVQLKRVGEFKLPTTDTVNPLGGAGRLAITGGAVAPDGKRVALRTYADAFEWDVPDGDVVKAITTGKPRITPLPNEPQGEAIAYSRDGKNFLTVSDITAEKVSTPLLRYTPSVAPPAAAAKKTAAAAPNSRSGASSLSLDQITYLVAGVGLLGALLVAIGIFGIRRSRAARRGAARAKASGAPAPSRVAAAAAIRTGEVAGKEVSAAGAPRRNARGAVYGGEPTDGGAPVAGRGGRKAAGGAPPPPEPPTPGGGVYRASAGRGGAVYGARRDSPPGPDGPDPYDDPRTQRR